MKILGPILALVVITCAAYTCVGRLVPQVELHPERGTSDINNPTALSDSGKKVFTSACAQCHGPTGGGTDRAPGLDNVAVTAVDRAKERSAATRKPYTADDYLAESLMDPGAYLVKRPTGEPYGNIMSFKLSPTQTLAMLAYVQSFGGTPTVRADSELWKKWGLPIVEEEEGEGGAAAIAGPVPQGAPEDIVKKYGCVGCHDFQAKTIPSGGGPWLSDIGARMSPGDILTQIIIPDSQIAEPPPGSTYPKGLMRPTLEGNGFYQEVGQDDMQKLVLWLAQKKGQ